MKALILDGIAHYKSINEEAMACKNGDRVWRPAKVIQKDLLLKKEKFGGLSEEDLIILKEVGEKLKI